MLDELAEFQRPALEALRQPIEDGEVAVARAAGRAVFPARFQLVATMNLCPCGARGDPAAECSCSPQRLAAFRDKLSRALLDRFDLVLAMPRPRAQELAAGPAEPSGAVRSRVESSRCRPPAEWAPDAEALLDRAVERVPLSGRGRARTRRVAQTLAALAERGAGRGLRTSPRRFRTGPRASWSRRERAGAGGLRRRDRHAPRRRAARPPVRGVRSQVRRRCVQGDVESGRCQVVLAHGSRVSAAAPFDPRSTAGPVRARSGRRRAAAPARRCRRRRPLLLAVRSAGRPHAGAGARPRPGSSSSAGSPAASTARLIAARSKPEARRSVSSAAGSTATIPRRTESSPRAFASPASSSPSTRREWSRPRGGFRPETESSPASRASPSSSRRASGAAL